MRAAVAVAAAAVVAVLGVGPTATAKTGQSPDCRRFCMSVKPAEGPEGSVFTFRGRHWRPNRRVTVTFGVYCRPDEACIAIAYVVRLRTGDRGGFTFRQRAGAERPEDARNHIHAGGAPTFSQRVRDRTVMRRPRYRVILPPG